MKVAVICANFRDYDDINENLNLIDKNKFDWFLFTDDKNLKSEFWTVITEPYHLMNKVDGINNLNNLDKEHFSYPMMESKYYKLQTHHIFKDYDYFVWIDASIIILNNNLVNDILNIIKDGSVELINFIHPERNNIIDEKNLSMRMEKYKNQNIPQQVDDYIKDGFVEKGLYCCGFFCRKNNGLINKIFDEWWIENIQKSFQDQISYPYVLWKNGKKPDHIIYQSMYHNQFLGKINYPHKPHR
jgi:hypothetical protein